MNLMCPETEGSCPEAMCDGCSSRIKYVARDNVMHPPHYARWAMEPIEFIAINDMPWWMANVVKYIMRYDAKDGLQDLYKARSYLEMKIRQIEGMKRFWDKPVAEERTLSDANKKAT